MSIDTPAMSLFGLVSGLSLPYAKAHNFTQGFFSEDDTSLVTEMFLRNPRSVMAKDLQADISLLDNIPKDQL